MYICFCLLHFPLLLLLLSLNAPPPPHVLLFFLRSPTRMLGDCCTGSCCRACKWPCVCRSGEFPPHPILVYIYDCRRRRRCCCLIGLPQRLSQFVRNRTGSKPQCLRSQTRAQGRKTRVNHRTSAVSFPRLPRLTLISSLPYSAFAWSVTG